MDWSRSPARPAGHEVARSSLAGFDRTLGDLVTSQPRDLVTNKKRRRFGRRC